MWVNERPQHVLTGRQRHDGLAVRQVLLYRLYDRGGIVNPTLHEPDFTVRVARLVLDRLVPWHPTYPRHRSTVNISRVAPGLAQDEIRLSHDVGLRSAVLWSHGSVALWCIPRDRISVDSTLSDTPHVASLNYSLRPHPKKPNSQETSFLLSSVSFPLFQLHFSYSDRRVTDRILLSLCPFLTCRSVTYLSLFCHFALAAWNRRSDRVRPPFSRVTEEKNFSVNQTFLRNSTAYPCFRAASIETRQPLCGR